MAGNAMTPLATITLGAAQATVTFSGIVGTYRDLMLVAQPISTADFISLRLRINGNASSIYNNVYANGDGSNANSSSNTNAAYAFLGGSSAWATSSGLSNMTLHFLDYSATDKHKSFLERTNIPSGTFSGTNMVAHRYADTAAITSLQFSFNTGNIAAGSVFTLYGVLG
jgi:hypothetical protein